jgi:hypothetical protein
MSTKNILELRTTIHLYGLNRERHSLKQRAYGYLEAGRGRQSKANGAAGGGNPGSRGHACQAASGWVVGGVRGMSSLKGNTPMEYAVMTAGL